jgi:hypothetical protein
MSSFVREKEALEIDEIGYVFGKDDLFRHDGNNPHLINDCIAYFSNNNIDLFTIDNEQRFIEKIIGIDKKDYRFTKESFFKGRYK